MFDETDDVGFRNELAIDLNTFTEGDEMGRGEETYTETGSPIDALQHGAGGTFAVGAGDMDEAQLMMGIAGEFSKFERVGKTELGSEPSEGVEELDSFGVRHRSALKR